MNGADWLTFSIAVLLTLVAIQLVTLLYCGTMAAIGRAGGIVVERISCGYGRRLVGFTCWTIPLDVCLIPIGGFTKFKGHEVPDEGPPEPDAFAAASVPLRLVIFFSGPASTILLGLVLLAVPIVLGSDQLVKTTKEEGQIWPCAMEGLAILPTPTTSQGQWEFFQQTSLTYLQRLVTFQSLRGWSGLIGYAATIEAVATHSWAAWTTCLQGDAISPVVGGVTSWVGLGVGEVPFVNSTGLGAMVAATRRRRALGGDLVFGQGRRTPA